MRTLPRLLPLAALALLLCACAVQQQTPAPAQAQPAAPAQAQAVETAVVNALNALLNDCEPGSAEYDARKKALAPALDDPELSAELRRSLAQVLAFDPPRLRQRWQALQQSQESAAAQYAANQPEDTRTLVGARVLRRLGPALYLLRLPGGDSALLSAASRLKPGATLKNLYAVERSRPKPDAAKGDLVDELADQPRSFVEISRQEAKAREAKSAPALSRLRGLEAEGEAVTREAATELARLDALTRDVNAVIGPRLLPRADAPAPALLIRGVKRVSKSYSRGQYYRYALPVTGRPQLDALLKAHLEERRAEVQELLKATGVGRGRARVNTDRIAFAAFTASPGLLSIRFEQWRDTGGAHPNQTFATFALDLPREKRLGLADLFTDTQAALAVLSELATRRLSLALDGALFAEGVAPQAQNFALFVLDGADLVFTFPTYQTASHAQGPQALRTPLFQPRLLPLLRPELRQALAGR